MKFTLVPLCTCSVLVPPRSCLAQPVCMLSDLLIQSGLSRPGCHQVDELLVEASWNTRSLPCSLLSSALFVLCHPYAAPRFPTLFFLCAG